MAILGTVEIGADPTKRTPVRYLVLAVQRFLREEGGATAVEYAIIAGAIFLFIVTGVQLFGQQVGELFNSVTSGIATVSNG
jgi:pilus assembly protein Flp/PilA